MVEDKNFITEEHKNWIENFVLSNHFPYFLMMDSCENDGNKFLGHFLKRRPEETPEGEDSINSPHFESFVHIFKTFIVKNNIECKEILRAAVNLTFNTMHDSCPIHEDHKYPHKQFLMYLNDCYDKDAKTVILTKDKKYEVTPEKYKAVCFDNDPHYMIFPKKDIRVVLVVTFR